MSDEHRMSRMEAMMWNVERDPGWSFMRYMRYRSRRDLIELVTAPGFVAAHPFKTAAMPNTFSFPTQPMV